MSSGREEEHRRALETLYVAHERGLYNAAYRYVWNADDARDVVQDAFVRLWDKRERVEWDRAAGLAYTIVLGIAHNCRRGSAIRRALGFGRGMDSARGDRFIDMYVNELTQDYGDEGRLAVQELLSRAEAAGAYDTPVRVEFAP